MAAGRAKFVPSKLSSICLRKVVEHVDIHAENIKIQPYEVKDKILHLMSKRGAFKDDNIGKVSLFRPYHLFIPCHSKKFL